MKKIDDLSKSELQSAFTDLTGDGDEFLHVQGDDRVCAVNFLINEGFTFRKRDFSEGVICFNYYDNTGLGVHAFGDDIIDAGLRAFIK